MPRLYCACASPLFRGGAKPPDGLFVVLDIALTVAISHAEVVLFLRVSLLSCDPRLSDGFVLRHIHKRNGDEANNDQCANNDQSANDICRSR